MSIEEYLAANGFLGERELAVNLIRRGRVLVGGKPAVYEDKPIPEGADVRVILPSAEYASRGGKKLEAALREFGICASGKICLDAGCSAGGFTDCLLSSGAEKVWAVDVGYGILDWHLRNNPRVAVLERTNARNLTAELVTDPIEIATIDVNHISLASVLPAILNLLAPQGRVIALAKPQFEIPRQWTDKVGWCRGVIVETGLLERVLYFTAGRIIACGFEIKKLCESPVTGRKGNREFFFLVEPGRKTVPAGMSDKIKALVSSRS